MLTIDLARRLTEAGLVWEPRSGDRFVVSVKGMEEDVFVISEITVDVHHFTTGDVIGFNGTTEWALDSVERDKVIWLPREDQLRDLLGDAFVSLERLEGGYAVTIRGEGDDPERHVDIDAERAYARAVAARLGSAAPGEERSA
ncbi:pilus assembly protein CpaE [Terrabacter sp. 2RAF25]|uniref:pilus assembly protein CpaE n=1 Tax=Terrabacter sp. 2RAF25 TaxID=3232998 RepID=UPI003F9AE01A